MISIYLRYNYGGSITPSGNPFDLLGDYYEIVTVNEGSEQTFAITPYAGYHITDVKVDGSSIGVSPEISFPNISCDRDIEVFFQPN